MGLTDLQSAQLSTRPRCPVSDTRPWTAARVDRCPCDGRRPARPPLFPAGACPALALSHAVPRGWPWPGCPVPGRSVRVLRSRPGCKATAQLCLLDPYQPRTPGPSKTPKAVGKQPPSAQPRTLLVLSLGPLSSAPVPSHGPCTSSPSSAAQAMWPEPSVLASLGLSSLVAANRKAVPGGVRVWGGQLPWNSEGAQLAGTAGHWEPGGAWQHCVGCRTSSWGHGPPCPVPVFPAWRLVRTACRARGPHAGRVGTAAVFRGGDQGPRKPKASRSPTPLRGIRQGTGEAIEGRRCQ